MSNKKTEKQNIYIKSIPKDQLNPNHKEDFDNLLKTVSKGSKEDGQTSESK